MLRDEEEKNAKVILSEGESEAARLINDAVKSFGTGIVFWWILAQIEIKKLETAKHIAEQLAKSPNITWIPTGAGVSNLLNLKTFWDINNYIWKEVFQWRIEIFTQTKGSNQQAKWKQHDTSLIKFTNLKSPNKSLQRILRMWMNWLNWVSK